MDRHHFVKTAASVLLIAGGGPAGLGWVWCGGDVCVAGGDGADGAGEYGVGAAVLGAGAGPGGYRQKVM
jgi:hypothetical protein